MVTESPEAARDGQIPYVQRRPYPCIPDGLAVIYVAVTTVIMAYSLLFNVIPILLFLLLWLRHFYYKGTFTLRPSTGLVLALLLPLLCCYSAFWSDYPVKTLYTALEFLSLSLCAIIISRTVPILSWVKGLALGILVVLVATLVKGTYAEDIMSKTYSLVGLFGSKNQVGFFAELGVYLSLLLLFTKMKLWQKILFSVIPLAASAYCLVLSNSATSIVSLAVVLCLTCAAFLVTRISRPLRLPALILGFLITAAIVAGIAAGGSNITNTLLEALGKSPTLTGRTYLWAEGLKNGLKEPVLGHGYSAFWVPGRPEAERYWHEFYIANESGFHFHNLFIQSFVDLGGLGFALISLLMLICCYKSLRLVLKEGMGLEPAVAFGLSFMFLVRAFVEVDLLGPFGAGPLLFLSIIPRLEAYRSRGTSEAPPADTLCRHERGGLAQQLDLSEEGAVLDQGAC